MKLSKIGNQTNSQDPQAVNSRVFVGNLNTFQCSKTDLEKMFQRYGRLAGISMHKGYAFIQFSNPHDARQACLGEDGRTVLGQTLDVNLVCEPKFHQIGRKRQNLSKTGNDWDYYYDSYYASKSYPLPRLVPPVKKPRLMFTSPVRIKSSVPQMTSSPLCMVNGGVSSNGGSPPIGHQIQQLMPTTPPTVAINQLKTYSNADILICGNCREMFSELQELLDHKKTYCKLRFTCKCTVLDSITSRGTGDDRGNLLLCVQCKDTFDTAWDLMQHAQSAHMIHIYEMSAHNNNNSVATVNNNFSEGEHGSGGATEVCLGRQNGHHVRVTSSEEKDNQSEEEEREDMHHDMQHSPPVHHIKSATEAIVHALSLDQSMLIIENHHLDNGLHSNKKELVNPAGSF
uniref:Heterogeneous nuclear ribonucleoprotein C n=1 Tax=Cacopsylla melanoneura TaxID=428564 RepID=A0A8D8PZG8_9HEMI